MNSYIERWHAATYIIDEKTSKKKTIFMHRLIMNVNERSKVIDHIDHNALNNKKINLRICTQSENCKNKTSQIGSTSQYLGVSLAIRNHKKFIKKNNSYKIYTYKFWIAQITINYKNIFIGRYQDEIDAAKAYDKAAIKYHGKFANLNFK